MDCNSINHNLEWVSVKDKLPSEVCRVLAAKHNGKVCEMSYHTPFDRGERVFQWWGFGRWIDQHSQVTHWVRIPEHPECKHNFKLNKTNI